MCSGFGGHENKKGFYLKKTESSSYVFSKAFYTMSKKEKHRFCEFLKSISFPNGYASKICRCVNVHDGKISRLKSHDCHVLIQRLLPLWIWVLASKQSKAVAIAMAEIRDFFMQLCCKALSIEVGRARQIGTRHCFDSTEIIKYFFHLPF